MPFLKSICSEIGKLDFHLSKLFDHHTEWWHTYMNKSIESSWLYKVLANLFLQKDIINNSMSGGGDIL